MISWFLTQHYNYMGLRPINCFLTYKTQYAFLWKYNLFLCNKTFRRSIIWSWCTSNSIIWLVSRQEAEKAYYFPHRISALQLGPLRNFIFSQTVSWATITILLEGVSPSCHYLYHVVFLWIKPYGRIHFHSLVNYSSTHKRKINTIHLTHFNLGPKFFCPS